MKRTEKVERRFDSKTPRLLKCQLHPVKTGEINLARQETNKQTNNKTMQTKAGKEAVWPVMEPLLTEEDMLGR